MDATEYDPARPECDAPPPYSPIPAADSDVIAAPNDAPLKNTPVLVDTTTPRATNNTTTLTHSALKSLLAALQTLPPFQSLSSTTVLSPGHTHASGTSLPITPPSLTPTNAGGVSFPGASTVSLNQRLNSVPPVPRQPPVLPWTSMDPLQHAPLQRAPYPFTSDAASIQEMTKHLLGQIGRATQPQLREQHLPHPVPHSPHQPPSPPHHPAPFHSYPHPMWSFQPTSQSPFSPQSPSFDHKHHPTEPYRPPDFGPHVHPPHHRQQGHPWLPPMSSRPPPPPATPAHDASRPPYPGSPRLDHPPAQRPPSAHVMPHPPPSRPISPETREFEVLALPGSHGKDDRTREEAPPPTTAYYHHPPLPPHSPPPPPPPPQHPLQPSRKRSRSRSPGRDAHGVHSHATAAAAYSHQQSRYHPHVRAYYPPYYQPHGRDPLYDRRLPSPPYRSPYQTRREGWNSTRDVRDRPHTTINHRSYLHHTRERESRDPPPTHPHPLEKNNIADHHHRGPSRHPCPPAARGDTPNRDHVDTLGFCAVLRKDFKSSQQVVAPTATSTAATPSASAVQPAATTFLIATTTKQPTEAAATASLAIAPPAAAGPSFEFSLDTPSPYLAVLSDTTTSTARATPVSMISSFATTTRIHMSMPTQWRRRTGTIETVHTT